MQKKTYYYKAFDLIWSCDFFIPEFYKTKSKIADVIIRTGKTPEDIHFSKKGIRYQMNEKQLLLSFENIGIFFVNEGREVIVEKEQGVTNKEIRAFLLTTIIGVILNQRKRFPIHASAIALNNKAILFSGSSGVGKSTIASSFALDNYKIITDDISAVEIINDKPFVLSSFPALKLWPDSIRKLLLDSSEFVTIRSDIEKRRLIKQKYFNKSKFEIRYLFILKASNSSSLDYFEIKGVNKFNYLKSNLYRLKMIDGNENKQSLFKMLTIIANNVIVIEIHRPKYPFNVLALKNMITTIINSF